MPMLTLEQALDALMAGVATRPPAAAETVPTSEALGRVLAVGLVSSIDVPPADNSAMDGYALRSADVPGPGTLLPVSQRIPAGVVGMALQAGTAARIFTGAQLPAGADAVVMQEQCEAVDDEVRVNVAPEAGRSVRRRGEDVRRGSVVLPAGTRLTPQALGLAATVGAATLRVSRRPRVALFSTGDELAVPGEPLRPGAIYNSNRITLRALVEAMGGVCTDLGIVPDNLAATREALRQAASGHDVVLTSGGVSVGEEDHLKPAIEAEGRLQSWQLAIKPGKPFAYGEVPAGGGGIVDGNNGASAIVLGLPGNPVSSFVTFLLLVRPVLLQLQGADPRLPTAWPLQADFDGPRADRRREFLRVRLGAEGKLELFANQGSGVLTSAVWGDGLVDNPAEQVIRRGDTVRFLPFSGFWA